MPDPISFPNTDDVLDTAARWFAALDAGTADIADFEAWRAASPSHAIAYARVVAGWEALAERTFEGAGKADKPNGQTSEIRHLSAAQAGNGPRIHEPSVSRRNWLKAAAVGAPVLAMGATVFTQRALAWHTERTSIGEVRKLALPDGSHADLNTDSVLRWKVTDNGRHFQLERGEMALDLVPGAPSILEGGGVSTPLEAGVFHAQVGPGTLEITLVSDAARASRPQPAEAAGARRKVRSSLGQLTLPIKLHESVVLRPQLAPVVAVRSTQEAEALMAWRKGEIIFLDLPLSDAVARFNRYLTPGRRIIVSDPALAGEHVGGRFAIDNPAEFMESVALTLGARVTPAGQGFQLVR